MTAQQSKADERDISCEVLDSGLSFVAVSLGRTISQGCSLVLENINPSTNSERLLWCPAAKYSI